MKYPQTNKNCTLCGESNPHTELNKGSWCKSCKSVKDKEYYQKNREKIIKKQNNYYQENREKILEFQRSEDGLQKIRDWRHNTGRNLNKGTKEFKDMIRKRPQNNMFEQDNPMWTENPVNNRHSTVQKRVAEKMLGRKISGQEAVHHIDGNPLNNNPKNLQVMLRGEHTSYHMQFREQERDEKGRFICH